MKLEIRRAIYETLPQMNNQVKSAAQLTHAEIKEIVVEKVKKKLYADQRN